MRVALQADQLAFAAPGGIATYVRNLAPALARGGADVTLLHARSGAWSAEPWMAGMRIAEVPRGVRTLYPAWDLLGWPPLRAEADVIHATNPAGVPPRSRGRALVVTVHDLAVERMPDLFPARWRSLYRAGLRAAVRRADLLLVPSRATAADLLERTGADAARVRVTPLAASLPAATDADGGVARRARLGLPDRYVLAAGTLEPRKNLARLVRAYRRAVAGAGLPHALVLAGPDGWGVADLDREVAACGAGTIVRTGSLAAEDLDATYRGAAAFLYPSLLEGFGLPVLEAMARGVPVVTSTVSSLPEVAGDAALLVEPTSEDAIAAAIVSVVTDAQVAARLAAAGRGRAATFSWDETARLTLEAYRSVTA